MKICFRAWGHDNISATHKTTFELTKDSFVTPSGDCILGIEADFDKRDLMKFSRDNKRFKLTIKTGALEEVIFADCNPSFNHDSEFVVRLGNYSSNRTFGVNADKSAFMFSRDFIDAIKLGSSLEVCIEKAA